MFLLGVPLLIIPFAVYNIIAFLLPGLDWAQPLAHVEMMSQAIWTLTLGDLVVAVAVFILFLEVVKSIQAARRSIVDHLLSLLLFLAMLAEFLLVKEAATATFFLLLVTAFVDVIGGFAFSLKAMRRKVAFEGVDQVLPP
ncbi:MAG: hypothetical protein ACXWVL_01840 [Rhodoplanes sp.]|jgi:hypothetical protein|nr:hypothetical protein [Rhodoplanes sp.]